MEARMPHYTPLVTLVAIVLYVYIATRVAAAHKKFGVKLPSMGGNPDFERVARFRWHYHAVGGITREHILDTHAA
jgi:hypothetical protein